ncbi:esterase-like activity of phytase family protein [Qipengyuania gaetbuli]|uniref:esterase-like activity of phytase family protein n=1 Tax=Qipengyuania gaetbuli TaxID=266952 RepID=UPI001CD41971|nr:esterase-like activity of phytase family protein [Qipengyuania gaetbuli]MCA0910104.1 esterase-like activity of phytase family protein [Qipengyuania gaetbuli]
MRPTRLILCACVIAGLTPGTFLRSEIPPPDLAAPIEIVPLDTAPANSGPLTLAGAWEITGENDGIGGYSALLALDEDTLLAASDAGRVLILPRPDRTGLGPAEVSGFTGLTNDGWIRVDVESLVHDPATGAYWAGIEGSNHIVRFAADRSWSAAAKPASMQEWGHNTGAEAMVLLPDGRAIVIEEGVASRPPSGIVFDGDPVRVEASATFTLDGTGGYKPADATMLPDGRVAVLLRAWALGLPPRFSARLAVFDPAQIADGATIALEPLADLGEGFPSDNYEGLLVTGDKDGDWTVWLVSDDNFASFQRSLLLKLDWPRTRQKARR